MHRYGGLTKTLHWGLALLLIIEVPAGFVMSATYGPSFKDPQVLSLHLLASQFHHTGGFIVLIAAMLWAARRLGAGRPDWDPGQGLGQRWAATAVQTSLLLLLIFVPWAGWTALSALADSPQFGVTHRWLFGFDGLVPRIWEPLPFSDPRGYRRFAQLHVIGLWAGLGLLAAHVGAALWHHFVKRDRVLRRMWPLGES